MHGLSLTLPEPNERYQEFGECMQRMRAFQISWVDRLENAGNLHPKFIEAHNNILRYGLEGHTGWFWVCEQANDAFPNGLRERDDSQRVKVRVVNQQIILMVFCVLSRISGKRSCGFKYY